MGTSPPIAIAVLGWSDTLFLMVLALVVFGPRRLPQIGRQIGKLMYEFRKASNDFKFQMEEELRQAEEADRRKKEEEARQRALAASPPPGQTGPLTTSTADSEPSAQAASYPSSGSSSASPYPGESTYPELAAQARQPEDATAAAAEAARLRIEPRIQPPSTGEVVPAQRPGGEAAAEPPGAAPDPQEPARQSAESGAAANDGLSGANAAERSEPAAHHG